jgi:hypothetical protein
VPRDFIDEVKPLYDVLACAGSAPDAGLDAKVLEGFCKMQQPRYQTYREHWGT